jgi:AcrR family transcriptional regulator
MPRTRPELQREDKMAEILEVAERQLRDGGFEALSMAGIARELGLAQNAIYWYFPSRAELFVATLRRILEDIAERKPRGEQDVIKRILWWTDQFAPLYAFRPAMQEQARTSQVVAQFVKDLDDLLDRMLTNAVRDRVSDDELAAAVESFRATVTGTYAQGLSPRRRREVLSFSLGRLLRA